LRVMKVSLSKFLTSKFSIVYGGLNIMYSLIGATFLVASVVVGFRPNNVLFSKPRIFYTACLLGLVGSILIEVS